MLRTCSALLLCTLTALTAFSATREEEAKKYAGNLKHKDAKVRLEAVTELGKLGSLQKKLTTPYIADLRTVLKDGDPRVRGEAARVLGLIDPDDKKGIVAEIVAILKEEKAEVAREGQESGLGALGATSDDPQVKQAARTALLEARKKTESKREQKVIQAALQLITGMKKKN